MNNIIDTYKPCTDNREEVDLCDVCKGEILLAVNRACHDFDTWDYALLAFREAISDTSCMAHAIFYHGSSLYGGESTLHFSDSALPQGRFVSRESNLFTCKGARICGITNAYSELAVKYYRMNNHDYSVFSQLLNSVDLRYDIEKRALFDMRDDRLLVGSPMPATTALRYEQISDLIGDEFHYIFDLNTGKMIVEVEQINKIEELLKKKNSPIYV